MKKILFSLLMLCCMTAAWAQPWPPGVYEVGTLERFKEVISHRMANDKCIAEIKLTADIYLNDCPELCHTFTGTLDGNGYTIYAGDDNAHHDGRGFAHGKYLFTYSEGATFKNLTFKDFRADTDEHSNWSFLTSQATDGCVFENITFDHVSIWAKLDNGGAVAGYANGCTFKNITVKNGDFTVSRNSVGAVVGHATSCIFTNIEVSNCEVTSESDRAGGVVGHSNNSTFTDINVHDCNVISRDEQAGGVAGYAQIYSSFTNVDIINCNVTVKNNQVGGVVGKASLSNFTDITIHSGHIKANRRRVGGVAGYALDGSTFTNCVTKDQVSIWAEGLIPTADVGGIVGEAVGCTILNCINSAIVLSDASIIGGIVGETGISEYFNASPKIIGCLNTGLIICHVSESDVSDLCGKYKRKEMTCVTKKYNGIEYTIRSYTKADILPPIEGNYRYLGGIGGVCDSTYISQCANIGMLCGNWCYDVAGIAGVGENAVFTDCLVDTEISMKELFHPSEYDAIAGGKKYQKPQSITNCLAFAKNSGGDKCIYLDAAGDTIDFDKSNLTSGAYCFNLGDNWEQNLGNDPYPTPTGSKGLYHTRKVSNQYGTVCFPFPVKSDDKISYYCLNRKEEDGQDIRLVFTYKEGMIPGGTPLLFRAAEVEDADNPVELSFNNVGKTFTPHPSGYVGSFWEMRGAFVQKVFDETTDISSKNVYYVSGGEIRNAKKTTIAPFRAWVYGPNIETLNGSNGAPAKSISFVVEDEDGTVTALRYDNENVNPMHNAEFIMHNYYNLNGQRVSANHKGIVIKDGKKCVNK